jgi:hypothetical protein
MDRCVARRLRDHRCRISLGALAAHHILRDELPRSHRRRAATKRQGGRPRRSLRRRGQPDGFRPARSRIRSFSGHHVVRGDVYDLRHGPGRSRRPRCGIRRLHPPEILKACSGARKVRACDSGANACAATRSAAIVHATTTGSQYTGEAVAITVILPLFGGAATIS